jgi:hypothetical protein
LSSAACAGSPFARPVTTPAIAESEPNLDFGLVLTREDLLVRGVIHIGRAGVSCALVTRGPTTVLSVFVVYTDPKGVGHELLLGVVGYLGPGRVPVATPTAPVAGSRGSVILSQPGGGAPVWSGATGTLTVDNSGMTGSVHTGLALRQGLGGEPPTLQVDGTWRCPGPPVATNPRLPPPPPP